MDCGPTCLKIIAKYYGKDTELEILRDWCGIAKDGVSLYGLNTAAEKLGFETFPTLVTAKELEAHFNGPCIVHWNQKHFMVCYKIKNKKSASFFYMVDPAQGFCKFSYDEFRSPFETENGKGVVLLLSPSNNFQQEKKNDGKKSAWTTFIPYAKGYKGLFLQILVFLAISSVLGFIFPLLTQKIVDVGIKLEKKDVIWIIILAQLGIVLSRFLIDFMRSWALLQINSKINILFISDFLKKLVRLPISFFDKKNVGDIMQRIEDNYRVERFLTGESFLAIFSILNFIVFSILLAYYKLSFFIIFAIGNFIYVTWVLFFLKYRKELDNRRFAQSSGEQAKLIQIVSGISEIKINRSEKKEIWSWENIQANLYQISIKSLLLAQIQRTGGLFFGQFVNMSITYFAARSVVDGEISIGAMMSIMFVIGQLSAPIEQLIQFVKSAQDASISISRINEVIQCDDEYKNKRVVPDTIQSCDLRVDNISFSYNYPESRMVIEELSLFIPNNKVTAIVGASGSGKTTLMKLLLGFYTPTLGQINIGEITLSEIDPYYWRSKIGAVLQDGFIFSNTITENIALSDWETVDMEQVIHAAKVACINDYIDTLPLKYDTRIGMEGVGLSQGQKQRILIARMVYKNPSYIFLDEATNSLDANNERQIMDNLNDFFKNKTTVVIAHRLSTVMNADNIIVLDNGRIVEQGTHQELTRLKGYYYKLVKNQLEMGN